MPPVAASIGRARHRLLASTSLAALVASGAGLASLSAIAQQPALVRPASITQPAEPIPLPPPRGGPLAPAAPGAAPRESMPPAPGEPPARELPPGIEMLTLGDLEQIALVNNPSLSRAQAMVAAARGNWVQVGLPPNFSWGYLGQQLGSGNRASQHAMLLDGELITGGKLRLNREVAEQEVLRAEQVLYAQQQRVLTDIRVAFYEALLAQRSLELAQQLVQIARDIYTTAQRLKAAGEQSDIELGQAQIEALSAENSVNDARNRHAAAWRGLRAVLGVPQMPPSVLRGDLESIPENLGWDDTLNRLLSISPEVGAAIANLDRARAALVRARREPIPNIRLQGGPMQDQGIGGKTDGIVQVLLPLPLINRNQGGISQAFAELTAAERAVQQVELDLQNRLAPVYERYASAAYRVRNYRESILPAAEKTLQLVRQGWQLGEFPFLNLLTAQRTYAQRNQEYLQSLLDLRTATSQIDGLLLSNSLGTNPANP